MAYARFLTDEQIEEARGLRAAGYSWRQLGAHYGCDHQTVRRWILMDVRERHLATVRAWQARMGPSAHRRRAIRAHARAEARETGLPPEALYERWGVPTLRASARG